MTALDTVRPLAADDAQQEATPHSAANPAATRAAQAFVTSPQMKVLADIQQARAAKRSLRG